MVSWIRRLAVKMASVWVQRDLRCAQTEAIFAEPGTGEFNWERMATHFQTLTTTEIAKRFRKGICT